VPGALAILPLVALLVPSALPATTLEEQSLRAMVQQAELIVTGTCTKVESRWLGRTLVTLATVSVSETLKGAERAQLTLVVPGGLDTERPIPIAVTYPGAPVVMPGQGLVLLLEPTAEAAEGFRSVGFSQGVLPVVRDASGKSVVLRGGAAAGGASPLDEVRAEIQTYLRQQS
jgi:hypothetical protein